MNIQDFHKREKNIFIYFGSIFLGLVLWLNHYMAFGQLDFFDFFPSHEWGGLLLIIFGFFGIFKNLVNFSYPEWLKEKNLKKLQFLLKFLKK